MAAPLSTEEVWERSVLDRLIRASGAVDFGEGAERLLREFGSTGAILSAAGSARLQRVAGDKRIDDLIRAVGDFVECVLGGRVRQRDVLAGRAALLDYLTASMAFLPRESLRVLYLNAGHQVVADEIASEGTVDSLTFYAREIVIRALEVGAVGLILAHNHPSGVERATQADVAATEALRSACAPLGIVVLDHLVLGDQGSFSLRAEGLMA